MSTDTSHLADAALLGVAAGMRTFTAPAAFALRARFGTHSARLLLVAAAGAEMISDKHPAAPHRTGPPGLPARLVVGAGAGGLSAGAAGAALGVAVATASTWGCHAARAALPGHLGVPDAVVATGEDLLSVALAAFATRPR